METSARVLPNDTIYKHVADREAANMPDLDSERARFTWQRARDALDGLPGGGLNIAHEAVDRHVAAGHGERVAIRWFGRGGERRTIDYATLAGDTDRFANVLRELGLERGERVFTLLGRVPELHITVLGTLKAGGVYCPLFSAFGPEPVASRLGIGEGRVLVTTRALYKRKVASIREQLPALRAVLIVGGTDEVPEDCLDWHALLDAAEASCGIAATRAEDPALLFFTSGTTGLPKGALHGHGALVAQAASARFALDLRADDVYWCTADPGWVTGTVYGIVAPLTLGATLVVDAGEFDAARWYETLDREDVNVWYTSPTAIRMLMRTGSELARSHALESLRFMASVGEPLNPSAVRWSDETFGMPFHDNWWQTETGAILIANYASMDVHPGSMGKPLPGIEAAIVRREGEHVVVLETPDTIGQLAIAVGWPSMMREYIGEPERYARCFADGWYLSGDLARRDVDGNFWFVGRDDDLIKSAGHLIGPFEVESALMEHAAVAEAGVIGVPDEAAGELVKAFVALQPGYAPADTLRLELLAHARRRLGPAVAPRVIDFQDDLPKTRSGKIMRRLLKARELGLPEGDTSTLECASSTSRGVAPAAVSGSGDGTLAHEPRHEPRQEMSTEEPS